MIYFLDPVIIFKFILHTGKWIYCEVNKVSFKSSYFSYLYQPFHGPGEV